MIAYKLMVVIQEIKGSINITGGNGNDNIEVTNWVLAGLIKKQAIMASEKCH